MSQAHRTIIIGGRSTLRDRPKAMGASLGDKTIADCGINNPYFVFQSAIRDAERL